jgi:hypothetical protein
MPDQRPWDADLREDLHSRGDRLDVDVEAALRTVNARYGRMRLRRTWRRSAGVALAAAAAVVAVVVVAPVLGNSSPAPPVTRTTVRPTGLPPGTYRYQLTSAEIVNASGGHVLAQDAINNAGLTTWTIRDGHWNVALEPSETTAAVYPCAGTVSVDGDVATFTRTVNKQPEGDCVPPTWSARFTVQAGGVRWTSVSVTDFGWFFATKPWHRIG